MATLLQTLIPLLSIVALILIKVHSRDTTSFLTRADAPDSTSFTVDRFTVNPTDLTYQGDARVYGLGSTVLSLAGIDDSGNARKASVGRVLYSNPVSFWERSPARQASFETTIRFRIRPSAQGAAEGIAFFIAPVGTTIPEGSVGGNLGIYNGSTTPSIFAVEFDTNYNGWDPTYHHMGVNFNSRTSSNVTRFDAGTGQEVTTRINYVSNTRTITVVASDGSQSAELSYVFDLKTILPEEVQVGITSSTGWYDSIVGLPEIRSWYFHSSLVAGVNGGYKEEEEDAYIRQYVPV